MTPYKQWYNNFIKECSQVLKSLVNKRLNKQYLSCEERDELRYCYNILAKNKYYNIDIFYINKAIEMINIFY